MDDANASFSTGGGTGGGSTSNNSSSGGGKNSKGGNNNNTRGDNNNGGGSNNPQTGKTFHVEGFEGMEFTGNMDVVADGSDVNVTNVASSSSSSGMWCVEYGVWYVIHVIWYKWCMTPLVVFLHI